MENKFLTTKYLHDFKHHNALGEESQRFYNDELYLKIINKRFLTQGRKDTIFKLEELDHDNIVTPEFLLHDRKGTIGYAAKNYINYDYIDSLFNDESITLEDRKQLMIKLSQIIEYFKKKEYAYHDIHEGNILYRNGDIKLIDLDGGVFKDTPNCGVTYEGAYRKSNWKLALFTLSFLYKVEWDTFYNILNVNNKKSYNDFMKTIPANLKPFYEYVINRDFSILEGIPDYIDSIDQKTFDDSNEILQLKLK